jgi:hypothetical protein
MPAAASVETRRRENVDVGWAWQWRRRGQGGRDAAGDPAGDGDERRSGGVAQARCGHPGEAAGAGAGRERLLGGRTAGGVLLQIRWIAFTHNPLNWIAISNRDPI